MFLVIAAALAYACAQAAGASLGVRVLHEGTGAVTLSHNNATLLTVQPHTQALVSIDFNPAQSTAVQLLSGSTVLYTFVPNESEDGLQYSLLVTLQGLFSSNTAAAMVDTNYIALDDGIDIARLRVINALGASSSITISGITENCYNCRRPTLCSLTYGQWTGDLFSNCLGGVGVSVDASGYLLLDVRHPFVLEITAGNSRVFHDTLSLREHSSHTLILRGATPTSSSWELVQDEVGNNVWVPLLVALCVFIGLAVLYTMCVWLWERRKATVGASEPQSVGSDQPSANNSASTKPLSRGRIMGVDTFRGIALCIMIFVNYGGGGYWFLDHSKWNGLTVADLVFPWFVWLMGVSMAMSMASQRKAEVSRSAQTVKIVFRSIKLYALGMFLNGGSDWGNWRIPGVLQYFGFACLVNGLVEIWFPVLGAKEGIDAVVEYRFLPLQEEGEQSGPGLWHSVTQAVRQDLYPYSLHFLFMSLLLTIYCCVQYFLPVPGCPTGYTGPGGLAMPLGQEHCTGGAHRWVDLHLFGEHHMYHVWVLGGPFGIATCFDTYQCVEYDPEGALGMLTSTIMAFLGIQAGRVIVNYRWKGVGAMLGRWVTWGVCLCAIGTGLCGASKNGGVMPLNKNLWSPSFVAVMAGTGFLMLSLTYLCVDHWKAWSGSPFRFVGMNSILVYAGSEVLQSYFPFNIQDHSDSDAFVGPFRTHSGELASNLVAITCWCTIAYLFYRNSFFYNL